MDSAAKKLNSSRGASIILALVFLLVCVMVGSSVLMAAASNAGRSRSNRQEQQLYLVLSSALQLVADDLTGTKYTCQVDYWHVTMSDYSSVAHYFNPMEGKMTRPDKSTPLFAAAFCPALDSISNGSIKDILADMDTENGSPNMTSPGEHYSYSRYDSATSELQKFALTVTPDAPLAGYEAQVDVTIDTNYRITLTARMTGAPDEKALELFKNYYLTTTLTRSGGITSLTIPEMEEDGEKTISAGTITWKAGRVTREYQDPETPP